ncbi:hypothetical protein HYG81_01430 [Natrinema zhouii]|uniref:DUF7124 domain-containing protein n=1 Tax=Natrinema zhouii TaxID=1710539 RepID=A0A7D6CQ80_9EURY|nr:hypothetical protein [Natrinema zhouii]QLK26314.1 hypothetical protein HYG81_01430 [Natrinema zhouii]
MTDRIDLDGLETDADEAADEGTVGDPVWRDDTAGDAATDPDSPAEFGSAGSRDRAGVESDESETESDESDRTRAPTPHVPKTGDKTPAGIPKRGGDTDGTASETTDGRSSQTASPETPRPMGSQPNSGSEPASGPHGGGTDEMTMALTYAAVRRLEHPRRVFGDAGGWADWIGIVGDVPAHVVQKFQREHGIDADFFNGTGTDPGERLAEIDRNSMFYADRMVVVGIAGEDEPIADAADWEFVPLATAAEKAAWELETEP